MLKLSLVTLFLMTMATLTLAASTLPPALDASHVVAQGVR